jgi:hypothetical protein
MGILIFKGLTAQHLYKLFSVKGLNVRVSGLWMINGEQHGIGCDILKVIPRNMPQTTNKIMRKKNSWITWYCMGYRHGTSLKTFVHNTTIQTLQTSWYLCYDSTPWTSSSPFTHNPHMPSTYGMQPAITESNLSKQIVWSSQFLSVLCSCLLFRRNCV